MLASVRRVSCVVGIAIVIAGYAQSSQGIDPAAAAILFADAQYLRSHCP